MNKQELRNKYILLRNGLDKKYVEEASENISDSVIQYINDYIKKYALKELYIYGYMPLGNEVSLLKVFENIWKDNLGSNDLKIYTAFPKIESKNMRFYLADSHDDFEPGHFGVTEPKAKCKLCDAKDPIVLVPGVAFSRSDYRMGYGRGYYDRYFEKRRFNSILLGIAFKEQVTDELLTDIYDVPMNKIITNQNRK